MEFENAIVPTSAKTGWSRVVSVVMSPLDLDLGRILSRGDPLLDEGVPVVAMRALPQELRAAIAAAHADVRIEIKDGVLGQLAVTIDERHRVVELPEGPPDRLVNAERVRVLHQRGK